MLALAGREADGAIIWMTAPKTARAHRAADQRGGRAGRPTGTAGGRGPIALTTDMVAARASAVRMFQIYGGPPSYPAMLAREGAEETADVAIVGDASALGDQLDTHAPSGRPTTSRFPSLSVRTHSSPWRARGSFSSSSCPADPGHG
jgi:hypothetical protein